MSDAPLKIGILGAGHIAAVHARHAARVPGVVIAAVTDLRREKADALAAQYGASVPPDADALLASDIDAVLVAVPTDAHRALTEAALRAGKSVLCEKPLALSVTDCDALAAVRGRGSGVGRENTQRASNSPTPDSQPPTPFLAVGHVVRFFPEYAAARRQVQGGAIGTVATARTRRAGIFPKVAWFADEAKSGGVLFDLLIHDLDFLLWTLGPMERVFAKIARSETVEYAAVTMRHISGAISQAEGIWGDPVGFSTSFEFAGDGGLITFDSRETATVTVATQHKSPVAVAPRDPDSDPYYRQFAAFVAAIRGESSDIATADEARAAVAVAEAAQKSARSGKAISLE